MRADSLGGFTFDALPAGAYLVRATRRGFMPVEYGQKRWNSAGLPVKVETETSAFLSIRLLRFSAINGALVDDSGVGVAGAEVSAYRKSEPPELVAEAVTDDRGIFRLHGLTPGGYLVRSAGARDEDGSYLPTFANETVSVAEARTIDLLPEHDASGIEMRSLPGRVFRLAVGVEPVPDGGEVTITVASTMWRKTVKGTGAVFGALVAGDYEVYAQQGKTLGAYQRVSVARDAEISLVLPQTPIALAVAGSAEMQSGEMRVRRKDLAGSGAVTVVPLKNGNASLPRGVWEVMYIPPTGFYVSNVSPRMNRGETRADGWNEVAPIAGMPLARFTVAPGGSALHGIVRATDSAAGAPVFLEPYDPVTRKRVGDVRTVYTDMEGKYRFEGVGPGTFRLLSTFEYASPDIATMDLARAVEVKVDARMDVSRDLELYVI